MRADVLIIGAGLSGATAALAAKAEGAQVVVVHRGLGRTALTSGLFHLADAAPTPSAEALDLARAIAKTRACQPDHPFAKIPEPLQTLREGLEAWHEPLGALYDLDWNEIQKAPTAYVHECGALCYAQAAPRFCLALSPDGPQRIGIVELASFEPFRATAMARTLNAALAEASFAPRFAPLPTPFAPRARFLLPAQLAAALDRPAVLEELLSALRKALHGAAFEALLFPPVLGLATPDLATRLSTDLGLPVFEACAAQNSVLGLRLQNALLAALRQSGVELVHGAITALDASSPGVFKATLTGESEPREASRVVLASGKFLAGGLTLTGRSWREPLADCPLFLGPEPIRDRHPGHLSQADFFAAQPMAFVGLRTDTKGQVLDERGRAFRPGLFACGHLLGGFDAFAGADGMGVDIMSGWRAGRAAAGKGAT